MSITSPDLKHHLNKYYPDYDVVQVGRELNKIEIDKVEKVVKSQIKILGFPIKTKYEYIRNKIEFIFLNEMEFESAFFNKIYTIEYAVNSIDKIIYWKLTNIK